MYEEILFADCQSLSNVFNHRFIMQLQEKDPEFLEQVKKKIADLYTDEKVAYMKKNPRWKELTKKGEKWCSTEKGIMSGGNAMKKRFKLTFRQQCGICILVFLMNILLAHLFQTGLFHNLTWLICGGLFLVHPVCPENWFTVYPKSLEEGFRIGGAILIVLGLITRFGI